MVTPITGPITTSRNLNDSFGINYLSETRRQYKQKPPFTLNLPYLRNLTERITFSRNGNYGSVWGAGTPPPALTTAMNREWVRLNNSSYDKLRSQTYTRAELGVDLVEYKQSVRMIVSTVSALTKASRSIRRGNFAEAAHALRMKYVPPGVSLKKSFANNFLEYRFGWSPLVGTVYDCLEIMNDPKMWFGIERARSATNLYVNLNADTGSVILDNTFWSGRMMVTQGLRVRGIKNQTLFTLDQLGLINPAEIVWNLIPFSFVVDWFGSVGDYLRSSTDFSGLVIDSQFVTSYAKLFGQYRAYRKIDRAPGQFATYEKIYCERTTTLTGVALSTKRMKPPSAVRAATAISLLLQQLKK